METGSLANSRKLGKARGVDRDHDSFSAHFPRDPKGRTTCEGSCNPPQELDKNVYVNFFVQFRSGSTPVIENCEPNFRNGSKAEIQTETLLKRPKTAAWQTLIDEPRHA